MVIRRLYYGIKPFLPQAFRLALRKRIARRQLRRNGDLWPILPGSERQPHGWPGWPDGRQFALVLTHDVEGPRGLGLVPALADLEAGLGVRSAYNFVPEKQYGVPPELRADLLSRGFEVGVHDYRHDGTLYASRRAFTRGATAINRHLASWGAVGFRSGFMLRNLDWLHDLHITYDSSTFDTDPFEPQPGGAGTIFPYFVPRPASGHAAADAASPSRGYVELPYTLVQDSTLFLLLGHDTIEVWTRKLDWIARHGGMAMVITHPDYMDFEEGRPAPRGAYPARLYREFIQHVQTHYRDRYWQALPREVAEHVTASAPALVRAPARRRVCMVTHSFYESDNRVMRYAETLAARGDAVDVFALRRDAAMPARESINGVEVFRIQDRFGRREQSKQAFLWPILRFCAAAAMHITRRHHHHRYDFVHVHNIPDFLVFAALFPRLTGASVLLDIHDIVPEFFASKFGSPPGSLLVRALRLIERLSTRFAHHVIIANDLWLETLTARSVPRTRCSVFINNVDARVFTPRATPPRSDDRPIILFPGGLQWHQGLDIAIEAFARIAPRHPTACFHIYGDGQMKEALVAQVARLGLAERILFFDPVRIHEIARIMAAATIGVVPKRANSFGNEAYSTKIMEFMAVGVPVIVSSTRVDRFYFDDSVVRFFESEDVDALAAAMDELLGDPARRGAQARRAAIYAASHSWETRSADYLRLVDGLCDRRLHATAT